MTERQVRLAVAAREHLRRAADLLSEAKACLEDMDDEAGKAILAAVARDSAARMSRALSERLKEEDDQRKGLVP